MLEFKNISIITAAITLILCVILMLAPEVIFLIFDIEESNSAFFIGRRAAMLFLGFGSALGWAQCSAFRVQASSLFGACSFNVRASCFGNS